MSPATFSASLKKNVNEIISRVKAPRLCNQYSASLFGGRVISHCDDAHHLGNNARLLLPPLNKSHRRKRLYRLSEARSHQVLRASFQDGVAPLRLLGSALYCGRMSQSDGTAPRSRRKQAPLFFL